MIFVYGDAAQTVCATFKEQEEQLAGRTVCRVAPTGYLCRACEKDHLEALKAFIVRSNDGQVSEPRYPRAATVKLKKRLSIFYGSVKRL